MWLLAAPLAFLGLFFAFPLWQVLRLGADGAAWHWVVQPYARHRIATAFTQAGLATLIAMAAAIPIAWLHHTKRIRGEGWLLAVHAFPFVLPVFVVVYGLQDAFGPHGWLHGATGFDLLTALGALGSVALANAYYNYGFAARLLHSSLDRRPRELEAAARTLGASPARAFLRVSLRLLAPSLAATATLVFLFCFASFGVVLMMGSGEISTLETLLYQSIGGIEPEMGRAAVLGILQLAVNVALLWLGLRLARGEARIPAQPSPLRPASGRSLVVVAWILAIVPLLPVLTLLREGFRLRGEWSLDPWRSLLHEGWPGHPAGFDLTAILGRTAFYAVTSTLLAVALTLSIVYGARRLGGPLRRVVQSFAALPLGASSLLVGFGLSVAFGAGSQLDLRGGMAVVVVAHTLVSFPFVARILIPTVAAHDPRLDEAAALLGASPLHVALRVHWGVLRRPLLVATGFAVAFSLGDFGSSLVLMRQDTMGLAMWIGNVSRPFDPLAHAQATAIAGLLAVLAAIAYGVSVLFLPRVSAIPAARLGEVRP